MTTDPRLDLDALEREQEIIAKYPWWSEPETPRTDPHKVIALIQRVRQLERVRKAAKWTLSNGTDSYAVDQQYWTGILKRDADALSAALAALEETA